MTSARVSLGGQSQQFVGDTTLQYYVDKTHRVKGALKKPKAVRIRAVIDGPTSTSAPYLKVTGPGVTPIGDDCQLQAGSAVSGSGPTGPAGAAGADGAAGAQGPRGDPDGRPDRRADGAQGPHGRSGRAGGVRRVPQGPHGRRTARPGPAGPQGAAGRGRRATGV